MMENDFRLVDGRYRRARDDAAGTRDQVNRIREDP